MGTTQLPQHHVRKTWIQRALLFLIRCYQLTLSPLIGRQCRFYPTCSHYAAEAITVHGAARGSALAARRVCRCHPFNAGGVDLVPDVSNAGQQVFDTYQTGIVEKP